jgi:hypothetical protein
MNDSTTDVPVKSGGSETDSQQFLREKASGILTDDEEILASAAQTNWATLGFLKTDGVVVTNRRILLLHCGMFSFDFDDFHWKHVEDVHLSESFTGSTISVEASTSKSSYSSQTASTGRKTVTMSKLIKAQARGVYSAGQSMEEEWRERRRRRMMEEKQAERGHVVVDSSKESGEQDSKPSAFEQKLDKLQQLRRRDMITEEQFEQKKQDILDSI